jgi:hypothetical protein
VEAVTRLGRLRRLSPLLPSNTTSLPFRWPSRCCSIAPGITEIGFVFVVCFLVLQKQKTRGCWGGSQAGCYKAMLNRSWPLEAEYSYRQNPGLCSLNKATSSSVRVVDFKYILTNHAMMEAVALRGPVAVAISTYPAKPFTFYSGGVFDELLCNPIIPDHVICILFVKLNISYHFKRRLCL